MKILIADTVYPEFLQSVTFGSGTYAEELNSFHAHCFGTFDAYSRNLRNLGHTCIDVIVNHEQLQELWLKEHSFGSGDALGAQISFYEPDVVFLQDLSIRLSHKPKLLAAQCSCPWPGDAAVQACDVIATSFPHYVPRIAALGVKAVFNPLAFDPIVLNRIAEETVPDRVHDCVFVGGVGAPSHWKYGMQVLEAIASAIPTFKWWGYGSDTLPANSALRAKYQGPAWGLDMYRIFKRAKIVVNRHGEVSGSFANNMRLFEATGCGALLVTEAKDNLADYFASDEVVAYRSPEDAVEKIQRYLKDPEERQNIAFKGMKRVAKDHTYSKRMQKVSDILRERL